MEGDLDFVAGSSVRKPLVSDGGANSLAWSVAASDEEKALDEGTSGWM